MAAMNNYNNAASAPPTEQEPLLRAPAQFAPPAVMPAEVYSENPYVQKWQQHSPKRELAEKAVSTVLILTIVQTVAALLVMGLNIYYFAGYSLGALQYTTIVCLVLLGIVLALVWVGAMNMKKAMAGWVIILIQSIYCAIYSLLVAAASDMIYSAGWANYSQTRGCAWTIFFVALAMMVVSIWALVLVCQIRRHLSEHFLKLKCHFGTQCQIGAVPMAPAQLAMAPQAMQAQPMIF